MNFRPLLVLTLAPLAMLTATPAHADGAVRCNSGPTQNWKPLAEIRKKAWLEGWTVQKLQVEGDCYEVYGRTPEGDNVESFHHPVTLQKILVLKRGRELFRATGY